MMENIQQVSPVLTDQPGPGTQTSVIQMLIRLNTLTGSQAWVNNTTLISGHQHMAIVQEKRLILQIALFY